MNDQLPPHPDQEPVGNWTRLSTNPENLRDIKTNLLPDGRTREQWLSDEYPRWRFNEDTFAERNSERLLESLSATGLSLEGMRSVVMRGRYETDDGKSLDGQHAHVPDMIMGYVEVSNDDNEKE